MEYREPHDMTSMWRITQNVKDITVFPPAFFRILPVNIRLNANWSQFCPISVWSRLLQPHVCLVWWALVEVIQTLNGFAYLSNSWANTHSPFALGLIFKHLEKTGPSVYAFIFLHICTWYHFADFTQNKRPILCYDRKIFWTFWGLILFAFLLTLIKTAPGTQ